MITYNNKEIPEHLQKYFEPAELGLEKTPEEYVQKLVEIFREVRRVLRDDGTLWLNLGDSYCGSWGNSGHRPELDKTPSYQRPKDTEYFNRGGWDSRRETPPTQKIEGLKSKDLIGIPWMVAFALRADGWYLRQDIIWAKPNPMPESVTDRCTKSHEYIFLMAKSQKYYYDAEAIKEQLAESTAQDSRLFRDGYSAGRPERGYPGGASHGSGLLMPHKSGNKERKSATERGCPADGVDGSIPWEGYLRNKRSVWTVTTKPYSEAHFATFPQDLITPCILAGCPKGGTVLDPFIGSGTTAYVSKELNRKCIGIELNEKYIKLIMKRTQQEVLPL